MFFFFPKKCEYVLPKLSICLKSILVNGVRSRSRFLSCFSLFYITNPLVQHHLLKNPPFPLIVDVASSLYMWVILCTSLFCPTDCLCTDITVYFSLSFIVILVWQGTISFKIQQESQLARTELIDKQKTSFKFKHLKNVSSKMSWH